MKLIDSVKCVFNSARDKMPEAALLHACNAVDATAKALYPNQPNGKRRFKQCVRDYMWLVEPMMGVGMNLVDTRYSNVTCIPNVESPDFADVVYHVHRCSHAHGDEVPLTFCLTGTRSAFVSDWQFGPNAMRMPDKLIWALTSIAVFSHVNYRLHGQGGDLWLSWSNEVYKLTDWWGRESQLRPIAIGWNTQRVQLLELGRLNEADQSNPRVAHVTMIAPPAPQRC